jgi:hypothetical protein
MSNFNLPPGCGTLPGEEPDDWGLDLDALIKAAADLDTGRWNWDRIHLCMTGKDADLASWGQQGIEFAWCDEDSVAFVVHCGKTFVGTDVCLNMPHDASDDAMDKAHEAFLDAAYHIVCDVGYPGDWSGDDWFITHREEATHPWVYKDDEVTPDYEATVQAIYDKAQEMVKEWEQIMCAADADMSVLSGWQDEKGNKCESGKPCPGAAWLVI